MSTTALALAKPLSLGDLPEDQRAAATSIRSWRRFRKRVRRRPEPLLATLPRYADCVLVAGCQRSGTTMLTRIVAGSQGFTRFAFTADDELDAALVLSGRIDLPAHLRYCFQTTYLNERYVEYARLGPAQKLIWVIRNPYSVVYSMVHHWKRDALDELYEAGIRDRPEWTQREPPERFPRIRLERTRRACIAYAWKLDQLHAIRRALPSERVMLVDYDALVQAPAAHLTEVFAFIGGTADERHARAIRPDSLRKAERLSPRQRRLVERIAVPVYEQCSVPSGEHRRGPTGEHRTEH